jgi:hypothetical protein
MIGVVVKAFLLQASLFFSIVETSKKKDNVAWSNNDRKERIDEILSGV